MIFGIIYAYCEVLMLCSFRVYLQQMLNDSVGAQIVDDFMRFNWRWVTQFQETLNWGDLSSNLLLVGQEGN